MFTEQKQCKNGKRDLFHFLLQDVYLFGLIYSLAMFEYISQLCFKVEHVTVCIVFSNKKCYNLLDTFLSILK